MKKVSASDMDAVLRSRVSPRYFEIGDRMVAAVPELTSSISEYIADWKLETQPGPINLSDEVFVPFIKCCLANLPASQDSLEHSFDFIEDLASDELAEIRDVAQGIVNLLTDNPNLEKVSSLIGPRTREMLKISRNT